MTACGNASPVLLLALGLTGFSLGFGEIRAGEVNGQAVPGAIEFSIAPQPLGAALEVYARVSRRHVLYNGKLAEGHRSSLVDGIYTPEVALQVLLAGTGLWADFKDADFFVVGLAPIEAPGRDVARQSVEHRRYYGLLQARMKTAFCGMHVLPDDSRVAARLWVGQTGEVLQVKTLDVTGGHEVEQRVDRTLRGLRLGAPPPAGFAQPITIVVLPSALDGRQECESAHQRPTRAGP